ncbi:GNAT family N-acetyltransferase [Patescibacteria group bacterium]|nr:GNAT family N-acetyltransferase [Patescibacteria group bacterium]
MDIITKNERGWRVSDYQKKYKKSILDLFKKEYPESKLWDGDFFEWQHFHNPAGKSVIKLAINANDEVVGFYCVSPQDYSVKGKIVHGSISLSTLVRDDFRGMGIFTILAQECFKECQKLGIKFTLGFPNQNSYPGFMKKLGFTDLGEMPLLIRPYNLNHLITEKFNSKLLGVFMNPIDWFLKTFRYSGNDLVEGEDIGRQQDDIWRKAKVREKILAVRDRNFLGWRTKWPGRNYKCLYLRENNLVRGYIILTTFLTGKIRNGLIADFFIEDSKEIDKIAVRLLKQADSFWKENKVDQAGCLLSQDSTEYKILKRHGYFNCPDFIKPQPMRVIVKWHEGNVPSELSDLGKWYITLIDYDVV